MVSPARLRTLLPPISFENPYLSSGRNQLDGARAVRILFSHNFAALPYLISLIVRTARVDTFTMTDFVALRALAKQVQTEEEPQPQGKKFLVAILYHDIAPTAAYLNEDFLWVKAVRVCHSAPL
jgi:hypothetical protein